MVRLNWLNFASQSELIMLKTEKKETEFAFSEQKRWQELNFLSVPIKNRALIFIHDANKTKTNVKRAVIKPGRYAIPLDL